MGVQISFEFDDLGASASPKRRSPRVRTRAPEPGEELDFELTGSGVPHAQGQPAASAARAEATEPRAAQAGREEDSAESDTESHLVERGGGDNHTCPAPADRAVLASAAHAARSVPRLTRQSLESLLRRLCGPQVAVVVTDNERTMISTRAKGGYVVLRIHHMFLEADPETLVALAGYLNKTDPNAGAVLFAFVKHNRARIRRAKNRRVVLRSDGRHHGLLEIYDEVNDIYFDSQVKARITWARQTTPQRRSRRSIKLGSYHSHDKLIRVHPVLDADWVPRFFVSYIVYHEMLHQVIPPDERAGRREYHGPAFRACERKFAHYDAALAWEQKHLARLLRG